MNPSEQHVQYEFILSCVTHGVFGSIAQEEILNMGSAVSWGMRKYAERGVIKFGKANYGYQYGEKKQWIIKEEEARVVRRIYQDTLDGKNYNQIAKKLTSEEIKSPTGKRKWSLSTIKMILENEVYRGNYLYQRSYTKDTLEEKIVPNNGELPQYLIENHHEGIISSSDWERVQSIIKERYDAFKNRNRMKFPDRNLINQAFENKFICGECGKLIGHRRYFEKNYAMHNWICNLAEKHHTVHKCNARMFHQKYLEINFMKMLLDIKYSQEFKRNMEELIANTNLNYEELRLEEQLKMKMENLNQKLYEVVDEELNKKGQDSKKVDELTEEILKLQSKIKIYSKRKEQAKECRKDMDWIMKELQELKETSIRSLKGLRHHETVYFRGDIFTRLIGSGKIFKDGKIVYKLKLGIEWCTDFSYADYKKMISDRKAADLKAEREEFLKGPEIKALLEFCKEPRGLSEMLKFMSKTRPLSKEHFRETIVKPLQEAGKLKWTIPEDPFNRKQKYYYVKEK